MKLVKILWLSEIYPGGASEITIANEGITPKLLPGEKILGNRYCNLFIVAEGYNCEYSEKVNTLQSVVERRINTPLVYVHQC